MPSETKTKRKSQPKDTTTISVKNRSDELYVLLNEDSQRTIVSGTHLDETGTTKKNSNIQAFNFHRRPANIHTVEDIKAPWRCIFCWKEPYEEFLGPLFGPFQMNEQCRAYFKNSS